jgi:group II intron reverse transcriptase/maturase
VKPSDAPLERSNGPAPGDTAAYPAEAGLWEQFLARENLAEALRRVEQNAGAPGIDGMSTEELRPWLHDCWPEIRARLDAGTYRPQPARRVMIPKPSGGERKLGVPAAVDRLICQALAQVLIPVFDPHFHPHSFGYRPGRSTHDAVERARQFINDDRAWCADLDLESFFDRVQHDALMARVARRVDDKRVLRLIRRYLEAGVLDGGLVHASEEGTPQGSPLSPLLSNVMLDDLDWELEKRGHYFVRYADDGVPRTRKEELSRSRVRRMRCCMRDEGAGPLVRWPFAVALQGEAANHREVRRSRAGVLSVAETARCQRVRCGSRRRARANHR